MSRREASLGFVQTLIASGPAPLALVARRARNAKTGTAMLQNAAQYLGEAAARLAAAYWLGRAVAERGAPTDAMMPHLTAVLVRGGSFGSFVGLLRESAAAVPGDGLARLSSAQPDARAIEALAEALMGENEAFGEDGDALRTALGRARKRGVLGFLEFLVTFRNKVYGHGALLQEDVCRRLARPFLDAVSHAVLSPALLEGAWLGRPAVDLLGDEPRRYWRRLAGANEAASEAEVDDDPLLADLSSPAASRGTGELVSDSHGKPGGLPRCLFAVPPKGKPVSLSFWVIEQEDDTGLSRFGFFQEATGVRSGGAKSAAKLKAAVYLDYLGGRFRDDAMKSELSRAIESLPSDDDEPERPRDPSPSADARRFGDFVIEGELGRGAMGIVYAATETSLGRRVALKVLPPSLLDDPVARGRFHREVLALARCDHPNVVRVLSSGVEDGRPWFAMELVLGSDLAQVAATLRGWKRSEPLMAGHLSAASSSGGDASSGRRLAAAASADDSAEPDAGESDAAPDAAPPKGLADSGDFHTRLARLFAGACEGIEEIHRRGLIHRDVKPANLMLTADGERLVVMDLGLVKGTDASASYTASSDAGFVGSARYAAPEQLQARLLRVDHRADIYSLGATLYELATHTTLYPGEDLAALLRQKLSDDPAPARSIDPTIPRDLEIILEKALARRPEDRYASAAELQGDLLALSEMRAIRARPPSAFDYLRLFYQRETRLVRLAAALAVLSVCMVALGFVLVSRERAKAVAERDGADVARAEAVAGRERAERLAVFIADDLYARLKPLGKLDLLEAVSERMVDHYRSLDLGDTRVLTRYADSLIRLGKAREAKGQLAQARIAYDEVTVRLEPIALAAPDDDEAAGVLAKAYDALSRVELLENATEPALLRAEKALAARTRLAERAPEDQKRLRDVASSERAVAVVQRTLGRRELALAAFGRAATLHQALADEYGEAEDQCELAADHLGRASVLEDGGREEDALAAYVQARELGTLVGELDPSNTVGLVMLGSAHDGIGGLAERRGHLDEALQSHLEALRIREHLSRIDPLNTAWRADVSLSNHRAAQLLEKKGDRASARKYVERDLAITERLAEAEPSNAEWAHALSVAESDLGRLLEADGDADRALEAYRKALAVRERLVAQAPTNTEWKRELAVSHERLGTLLRDQGKLDDALTALTKDVALSLELGKQDPGNAAWQRDLVVSRVALASVLRKLRRVDDAATELEAALATAEALVSADPKGEPARVELARVACDLGDLRKGQGRLDDAERLFRAAVAAIDELPGHASQKLGKKRKDALSALRQISLVKDDRRRSKSSEKRNYNDMMF